MVETGDKFDSRLVKNFDFSLELDEQKLSSFLAKAKMPLDLVPEQALHELGCGKLVDSEFVINNAGLLFFSKKPQTRINQAFISCFRYKANSMQLMIAKDFEGDLCNQVDEAEAFVKLHTRTAFKFDGFKRINVEEYPYTAIREAIINAVCHRDYSIDNNIIVNIFDDRVEVISPGSIPNNLQIEQVRGKSVPRNWLIANLFRKIGEIEKAGTGLNRMDELMLVHGLKKPEYEANQALFEVTFHGPKEKIFDLVKPSNETDLRELGLNKRQFKALAIMFNENQVMTNEKYRGLFNVSRQSATRDLTELVKHGLIEEKGGSKYTHYSAKR